MQNDLNMKTNLLANDKTIVDFAYRIISCFMSESRRSIIDLLATYTYTIRASIVQLNGLLFNVSAVSYNSKSNINRARNFKSALFILIRFRLLFPKVYSLCPFAISRVSRGHIQNYLIYEITQMPKKIKSVFRLSDNAI